MPERSTRTRCVFRNCVFICIRLTQNLLIRHFCAKRHWHCLRAHRLEKERADMHNLWQFSHPRSLTIVWSLQNFKWTEWIASRLNPSLHWQQRADFCWMFIDDASPCIICICLFLTSYWFVLCSRMSIVGKYQNFKFVFKISG